MSNVLEVLGVHDKEDVVSDLLAHALRESPAFQAAFARLVGAALPGPYDRYLVKTRVAVPRVGVPDLVICAWQGDRQEVLVVENKLKAEEGTDQTERYAEAACERFLRDQFELPAASFTHTFLTLFPGHRAKCGRYKNLTYEDLLPLLAAYRSRDVWAQKLVQDLQALLTGFYTCGAVEPQAKVRTQVNVAHPLDGGFLAFEQIVRGMPLPADLPVRWVFRSSQQGRKYYGVCIARPAWHPEELDIKQPATFDPGRHFHLHFELQYNVLTMGLSLYVHFELNPYMPEKRARQRLAPQAVEAYLAARNRFIAAVAARRPPELRLEGGGWNQVGKIQLELGDPTVAELRVRVAQALTALLPVLDEAFNEAGLGSAVHGVAPAAVSPWACGTWEGCQT